MSMSVLTLRESLVQKYRLRPSEYLDQDVLSETTKSFVFNALLTCPSA